MEPNHPLLKRAYELAGDREEIRQLYADWAGTYEADTLDGMGYVGPAIAAEALAKALPKTGRVLDAGCGTGLAGLELAKHSAVQIDGVDLSAEMLKKAAEKNVYTSLGEADLTRPLDMPENSYDGVISVGVFTLGHVPPQSLEHLARVAKPGAPIVVTVHEGVWDKEAYPTQLARLKEAGVIRGYTVDKAFYHEKENYTCKLCVLEAT